jgi:hypothetical protein
VKDDGASTQAAMNRNWALVRILLGLTQVMGATIALAFLVQTGASGSTMIATGATAFFVVLSRLLFSKSDRKD